MKNSWTTVRLGELLRRSDESIEPAADKEYCEITVRMWGKGVVERGRVLGLELTGRRYVAHAGQFIASRIDARHGATGLIPSSLEGALVTNDFPLFVINKERIEPSFLSWLSRTSTFVDLCKRASEGTTNRVRLREERFYALEIPLPPLEVQRDIVTKIDEINNKLLEAYELRNASSEEVGALHLSVLNQHFVASATTWARMPMYEAVEINDRQVLPTNPEFSQLPHVSGENIESNTCRLLPYRSAEADGVKSGNYLFSPGTILYSKIRPYLRKATFVGFRGLCSADIYPVKVVTDRIDPQFFKWSLVAEPFTQYANRLSGRTRIPKLNRKQFFAFHLSYPPLDKQRRIVAELEALQFDIEHVKRLQTETGLELDALLPAVLDRGLRGEL